MLKFLILVAVLFAVALGFHWLKERPVRSPDHRERHVST